MPEGALEWQIMLTSPSAAPASETPSQQTVITSVNKWTHSGSFTDKTKNAHFLKTFSYAFMKTHSE